MWNQEFYQILNDEHIMNDLIKCPSFFLAQCEKLKKKTITAKQIFYVDHTKEKRFHEKLFDCEICNKTIT